jgi:hypothetical protein
MTGILERQSPKAIGRLRMTARLPRLRCGRHPDFERLIVIRTGVVDARLRCQSWGQT